MPTVLRISGFRFFFYSLEGSEPQHIRVELAIMLPSFGCTPSISLSPMVFGPMS